MQIRNVLLISGDFMSRTFRRKRPRPCKTVMGIHFKGVDVGYISESRMERKSPEVKEMNEKVRRLSKKIAKKELQKEAFFATYRMWDSDQEQRVFDYMSDIDNIEIPASGAEYRYWCEKLGLPPLKRGFHKLPEGLIFEL